MNRHGLVFLAALCLCLSCSTGTDGDGNGTVLETLNKFMDVWNSGDVDVYESLLTDDFTFYFDPWDVGGDIPFSWGFDEEITAFNNLFDAVGAENVDVELDLEGVTEPEEGAVTYTVENIPYTLHVTVPDDDIIYLAQAHLNMELTMVDDEWVITEWWDRVSWRLLGSETTWGAIKANFYY